MLADTTDRPGLQEQYEAATHTSDLTLTSRRRGAADVLIAAGRAATPLSSALTHLRDRYRRPAYFTEADVHALADTLPKRKGKADVKRARTELLCGYYVAIKRAAERLPGQSEAMELLMAWASPKGHEQSAVAAALCWWVDHRCPVCEGRGKRRLPDAPVLGAECHHCSGSGRRVMPLGAAAVVQYIEDTVQSPEPEMRRLLR